jgi:hypothetical protein
MTRIIPTEIAQPAPILPQHYERIVSFSVEEAGETAPTTYLIVRASARGIMQDSVTWPRICTFLTMAPMITSAVSSAIETLDRWTPVAACP